MRGLARRPGSGPPRAADARARARTGGVRSLAAWPTMLRVGLAEMVAYRSELVIWILTATTPIIMLLVWDRAAAAGPIGGFERADFARYFCSGLVVRQLTSAWVVWELENQIRTGSLSPALLKPVSPLWLRAAENLVAIPFRVAVLVPICGLLLLWRPELVDISPLSRLPLAMLSIALAWAMNFAAQVAFGALAFYLDRSLGLFDVWFSLWALLAGYLFPLALLPAGIFAVVRLLPFRSMLAVPTEILAGQLAGSEALAAVALQAGWLVVFVFVARAVWGAGLRRYGAFGA
jgi:ABC-2 type transport system permease protein